MPPPVSPHVANKGSCGWNAIISHCLRNPLFTGSISVVLIRFADNPTPESSFISHLNKSTSPFILPTANIGALGWNAILRPGVSSVLRDIGITIASIICPVFRLNLCKNNFCGSLWVFPRHTTSKRGSVGWNTRLDTLPSCNKSDNEFMPPSLKLPSYTTPFSSRHLPLPCILSSIHSPT